MDHEHAFINLATVEYLAEWYWMHKRSYVMHPGYLSGFWPRLTSWFATIAN